MPNIQGTGAGRRRSDIALAGAELESTLASLTLSHRQLERVRDTLSARIQEGLRADGREIAAKPSFLRPPVDADTSGATLVVEWGGTQLRVARTAGGRVEEAVTRRAREGTPDAEELLTWQIDQLRRLGARERPVGFIFTFRAFFDPQGDAEIEGWGKEVNFPEWVGKKVGAILRNAARERGLELGPITVLDDSVAALLAGAALKRASAAVIAGTGTNVAAFFDESEAPKLNSRGWKGSMAFSLETDRFRPPYLTPWDRALDRDSLAPGESLFEKAVGGGYLHELFRRILPQSAHRPATSEELARVMGEGPELERSVARALFDRSADLVAASLAAAAQLRSSGPPLRVQVEGSLFKVPGYLERVRSQARKLSPKGNEIEILPPIEQLNVLGAGVAASQRRSPE